MTDLLVLVPSRGRPAAATDLAAAFAATATGDTQLVFALADDDPTVVDYPEGQFISSAATLVERLNNAATAYAGGVLGDPPAAIACLTDDHRPITVGWDAAFTAALAGLGTGIVYGDEQAGTDVPAHAALTSDLIVAVRYMAPLALTHSFLGQFWVDLGGGISRLQYLPGVAIEHADPPAVVDEADAAAYAEFRNGSGWVKAQVRAGGLL